MAKNDLGGVWRTIGGRRVFIKDGDDLATAMKKSGKFGNNKKGKSAEEKKYAPDKHIGFGDYNKDDIPVYDNKIDYTGDFSNAKLESLSDDELKTALDTQQQELNKALNERVGDQRTRNGRMDKIFKEARVNEYTKGVDKLKEEMSMRSRKQIERNNAQLEKDVNGLQKQINEYRTKSYQSNDALERYQYLKEAERLTDKYYERFRENERANAKIKIEEPNEKYFRVDAHAGYKDKFNDTWGKDGTGDKVVSAKMYTNDEFMEHLEDSNWHSERRQLLEANLTNSELEYIKNRTKVSAWGVDNLTGKEAVEKVIRESKNKTSRNAFQEYKKEHPNSKMSFSEFKKTLE